VKQGILSSAFSIGIEENQKELHQPPIFRKTASLAWGLALS